MAVTFTMSWAPPAVISFVERARNFLCANGPAGIHALSQDFQSVFTDRLLLTDISNTYLRRIASGTATEGDPTVGTDIFVLAYSSDMGLRIVKDRTDISSFSAKPLYDGLINYPSNCLILFDAEQPMTVDWYGLEDGADFDRFDLSLRIRHESTETYLPGSVIYVDARKRFPVLPYRAGDMYIVLSGAPVNCQIVSFEKGTLKPQGASMSSEDSSILCVMLDLLDPHQPSYPCDAVLSLASHPDHHVRWAAAIALGKYDRQIALELVATLAKNDPHKFIRDAAQRTLSQAEVTA